MPNNMISLPLQTEKFGKRNSSEFLKDEHWVCDRTEIKTWGPFVSLQPPCCSIHVCTYPDLQSHTEKLNKMRESMNKRICMSAHGQITQFSTYRRVQVKLKHFHPHLQLKVKILLSCPCSLFLPQIRIKERRDSWSSLRCGGFLLGAGAVIPSSEQLGGWCLPAEVAALTLEKLPGAMDEGLDLQRAAGFKHLFKVAQGSSPRVSYSYPAVRWLCSKALRCLKALVDEAI